MVTSDLIVEKVGLLGKEEESGGGERNISSPVVVVMVMVVVAVVGRKKGYPVLIVPAVQREGDKRAVCCEHKEMLGG